ncbi:hypothetical protein E3E14_25130 [Streptomyces sp. ICN441]|uniref:hypothetical protein n=1 Tax=Streptomyces sp. ICN441 TaxID=2558286 RepID=UPI0010693727|nr:hypothetical protein [Streptomyces sp. ICN441]TFE42470.1 hypothetical protein E3E14_25130 [Streptomyces sp. ICN441]
MYKVIDVLFRFAEPGELSSGRIADVRPGPNGSIHVLIEPGHATQRLLDEFTVQQASRMATGQWYRAPDTPENRIHPRRVLHAAWQLTPAEAFPTGSLLLSMERPQRHVWLICEGHASPRLEAEMTWILTQMVRNEVWITRSS